MINIYIMSFVKKIDKRLANEGIEKLKLSSRPKSNVDKIKIKTKKVPNYKGKPPNKFTRVTNNSFIAYRMRPAKSDKMLFRQESDQAVGPKPIKLDKQEKTNYKSTSFVRVGNNLIRGEDSVLDQTERLTFSRNVRREMSEQLNKLKINDHNGVADILEMANVAEKQIKSNNSKKMMSKFTGETKELIEVPEVKQELTQAQVVKKRRRLFRLSKIRPEKKKKPRDEKSLEKMIKDLNLSMSLLEKPAGLKLRKEAGRSGLKIRKEVGRLAPEDISEQAISRF